MTLAGSAAPRRPRQSPRTPPPVVPPECRAKTCRATPACRQKAHQQRRGELQNPAAQPRKLSGGVAGMRKHAPRAAAQRDASRRRPCRGGRPPGGHATAPTPAAVAQRQAHKQSGKGTRARRAWGHMPGPKRASTAATTLSGGRHGRHRGRRQARHGRHRGRRRARHTREPRRARNAEPSRSLLRPRRRASAPNARLPAAASSSATCRAILSK